MQVDLRRVLAIVLKDWPIDMRMRLFAWTKSMNSTACTSSKFGQEGAALNLSVNHRYLDRSCNLKLWPRIVTLSIFLVASACHPALSQNAWTGAFEGLGKAMVEIGRERAENERILELERQRAEIWARQQQNAREQELARQRQAAAAAASQKARDEQARQVEARQNGGTGSGFFVTDRGHIVTNAHVVGDYRYLLVKDSASKLFEARVVQIDKENDLALLVVDRLSKGLRISPSTTDLKGEEVFAIGYPMPGVQGQESKITNGIVSSMSGIKGVETWMQISAAIQGGNSGGPLVTPKGDVVGVVVATVNAKNILERSGSILQNVNYAIKSEYVLEFLRKASIANTAKPITGKPLRAVDDSTVMVFARDKPFSDSFVSKPSDDRVMSMEEREFADYQVVTRDASVSNIRGYLLKHPTGKYSGEAKKLFLKAEKVQWEAAKKDGTQQAMATFLANFPDGSFTNQAQSAMEKLQREAEGSQRRQAQVADYQAAIRDPSVSNIREYLSKHPNGQQSDEFQRMLLKTEKVQWERAKKVDSPSALSEFISEFSEGALVVQARSRLIALDESFWNSALKRGDANVYAEYMALFQQGRHRNEASARIAELKDQLAWERASSTNTSSEYIRYLSINPSGLHAAEAKQKIYDFTATPVPAVGGGNVVEGNASSVATAAKLQLIGQVVEIFPNYGYLLIVAEEGISISSSVSIETTSNKQVVGRVSKIQGERASIVVSNEINSIKIGDRVFTDFRNK
jgi:S1-C subfamily serine protease/outer membrane protein assembly factor BamD (BamD/ComL family)